MATFQSDKTVSTVQARNGIDITSVTGTFTVAANLAANDIVEMVKIPARAIVQEIIVSASASVAATSTGEVGDGADTDRYVTTGAIGSGAASLGRLNAATGHGFTYTSDDTIDIKFTVQTTPTTGAVLKLTAIYTLQA
jgi:hypothetical protein